MKIIQLITLLSLFALNFSCALNGNKSNNKITTLLLKPNTNNGIDASVCDAGYGELTSSLTH
jgi:hypothetical protein